MALEAAYAFNDVGATTVVDYSGNGRDIDLTGTNGAQVTGGNPGGALGKTGATMPTLPASVRTACQTDDRTIMFDALQNLTTWWVRFNDTVFSSGMWGVLNIGGSMAVQARDNTGSHNLATRPTASQPEAGTWHNYCATYVRSTGVISLYRDGTLASTSSFAAGTQLSTSADVLDAAEWSTTGATIDNLRLYSHALTAGEVTLLAGTPVGATVTGTVAASLDVLTAAIVGTRDVGGTVVADLGALISAVVGSREVMGITSATLGNVAAVVLGQRSVFGTATVALGALNALAVVPGQLPSTRLLASGREPATSASGREPRRLI